MSGLIGGLIIGLAAALFGVGWGLSGFCPGPAVAAPITGVAPVFAFVAAMVAGMAVYAWVLEMAGRGSVKTAVLASKQDG